MHKSSPADVSLEYYRRFLFDGHHGRPSRAHTEHSADVPVADPQPSRGRGVPAVCSMAPTTQRLVPTPDWDTVVDTVIYSTQWVHRRAPESYLSPKRVGGSGAVGRSVEQSDPVGDSLPAAESVRSLDSSELASHSQAPPSSSAFSRPPPSWEDLIPPGPFELPTGSRSDVSTTCEDFFQAATATSSFPTHCMELHCRCAVAPQDSPWRAREPPAFLVPSVRFPALVVGNARAAAGGSFRRSRRASLSPMSVEGSRGTRHHRRGGPAIGGREPGGASSDASMWSQEIQNRSCSAASYSATPNVRPSVPRGSFCSEEGPAVPAAPCGGATSERPLRRAASSKLTDYRPSYPNPPRAVSSSISMTRRVAPDVSALSSTS